MKHQRICIMCGRSYEYCPNCNKYADKPRWMWNFCSDRCNDICTVLCDYKQGKISAADARKQLYKLNANSIENLGDGFKKDIEDLMGAKPEEAQPSKKFDGNKKIKIVNK